MGGWESENIAIWHMAKVMQSWQHLTQSCIASQSTGPSVEDVAIQWLQDFINATVDGEPASLDRERLQRLVEAGSIQNSSTNKHLADFGVKLPKGTGRNLAF